MKKYLAYLLLCSLPLVSFGQDWKTFTDTAGFFTAEYPSNWVNKVKQGNRVFFTSPASDKADKFLENINISVTENETYGTELKLADLMPVVISGLKKELDDFKEESTRYFKWNNVDAGELVYTGLNKLDHSFRVRSTQWYCFYKKRLYVLTFIAADGNTSHDKTAHKIMNSILFK